MVRDRIDRRLREHFLQSLLSLRNSQFRGQPCQICFLKGVIADNIQIRYLIGGKGCLIDRLKVFQSRGINRHNTHLVLIFTVGQGYAPQIIRQCLICVPEIQSLPVSEQVLALLRLLRLLYCDSCSSHTINTRCNRSDRQNHA